MTNLTKGIRGSKAGLTLAELMVAAGILAVITVFSAQVMGDVSRVWLRGKGQSDTFTAARALMTRIRLDIERSLPRPELPGFAKDTSAKDLEFTTRVQGVLDSGGSGGGSQRARPLSFIRYRLASAMSAEEGGYLIREDSAFGWEEAPFGASRDSGRPRRLCPNVLGFTHRFVPLSGNPEKTFVPPPATNLTVAVQVALAICDDRTFQTLKLTGNLSTVADKFASLEPENWEEAVSGRDSTLPDAARQGIRVFQQVVPLPVANREN